MKIKEYWDSKINWEDIERELNKYSSINKVFPVNILKDASNQTPFYCHPIVRWFLYKDPSPLRVLDNIINELQSVCGIEKKKEFLGNPRNESWKFWSTLSELLLALHLKEKAQEVIFLREGKNQEVDIKAIFPKKELFFEVYTHQKFYYYLFELKEILDEMLSDSTLQTFIIRYKYSKKGHLELTNKDFNEIAEHCFKKSMNSRFRRELQKNYRTELYSGKNIFIYIENRNLKEQDDSLLLYGKYGHGDRNLYFKAMLEEIIRGKNQQLRDIHPNVLAVNLLFNIDLQTINWDILRIPSVCFYNIDSIVFFTNTIDREEITVKMKIVNPSVQNRDEFCEIIEDIFPSNRFPLNNHT